MKQKLMNLWQYVKEHKTAIIISSGIGAFCGACIMAITMRAIISRIILMIL